MIVISEADANVHADILMRKFLSTTIQPVYNSARHVSGGPNCIQAELLYMIAYSGAFSPDRMAALLAATVGSAR